MEEELMPGPGGGGSGFSVAPVLPAGPIAQASGIFNAALDTVIGISLSDKDYKDDTDLVFPEVLLAWKVIRDALEQEMMVTALAVEEAARNVITSQGRYTRANAAIAAYTAGIGTVVDGPTP